MTKDIRKLDELKLWDKNPRSILTQDFQRLKAQIVKLGQYKPLLITPEGVVLGGNMRLRAYKELGINEVWVSVITPKNEQEMVEYALSDNDRAGFYDEDLLSNLLGEFPDLKIDDFAIDMKAPQVLSDWLKNNKDVTEDEPPAVAEGEPVSKRGEIYQLGKHRLMCGDSTVIEDVEKLMNGQKADMVFTDPPYGVDYEGKTKDKLTIKNDKTTDVFKPALANMVTVSKAGAAYYVCCPAGNNFLDFLIPFMELCYQSSTIIWAKNAMVMGHGDYHYQHEPILYGWAKGASHTFYGDRTQTTLWQIDRPSASRLHPTMKPIGLVAKAIKNSSKADDIILDLFMGSGTTLMAAEQTDRTAYGMELDPRYVDVIRKRYAMFLGKEAEWQTLTPLVDQP